MEEKVDIVALGEQGVLVAAKNRKEIIKAFQANAVAGLCVQKRGGIPAIPTKEAVLEFMHK